MLVKKSNQFFYQHKSLFSQLHDSHLYIRHVETIHWLIQNATIQGFSDPQGKKSNKRLMNIQILASDIKRGT